MLDCKATRAADVTHPCAHCAFYGGSVWQPVAGDALPVLRRGFSRKELEAGQVLFKQGEDNRSVFCVSSGLVALRSHHVDGASTLMRLAYPGEIIGYRSFLGKQPHQTEARALLPSRICTVTHRVAAGVVAQNAGAMERLAQRCIREIDRSHQRIISTATCSNKERLAELLRRLMVLHGRRNREMITMRLPLSRMDLADLIGVQPETMSRLIRRLEKDGVFGIAGRDVEMPLSALSA